MNDGKPIADARAIVRMKRGDIGGLETLVRRYQVKAVQVAQLITRDAALADDVVQSAFIRVYERAHQIDAKRRFEPYFLRIVSNDAIKAVTRSPDHVSLDTQRALADLHNLLPDEAAGPEAHAEQRELRDMLRAALDQLSPDQRAAIVLRYFGGLSEEEIAAATGAPRGTVKWRLSAARDRLRGLLRQQPAADFLPDDR